MDPLQELGIQRWRLKSDFSHSLIERRVIPCTLVADTPPDEADVTKHTNEPSGDRIHNSDAYATLDWSGLQVLLDSGQQCPTCGPTNVLLGGGDLHADWMFVADAPSLAEVQQQQIFVGRAGRLFEAMLQALNLDRAEVYATSVFKCAPTDDLSARPSCNALLKRQIELVQPKVIVTFAEFAAQSVIRSNESLEQLRQTVQRCAGTHTAIVTTYSPQQMLENASLKALVWEDLKKCRSIV